MAIHPSNNSTQCPSGINFLKNELYQRGGSKQNLGDERKKSKDSVSRNSVSSNGSSNSAQEEIKKFGLHSIGADVELRKGSKEKREKALVRSLSKSYSMEDLEEGLKDKETFDHLTNLYSSEVFHDAESLPAVVLMNNGRFEDLTLRDVQDLFRTLDADKSGFLEFEEVAALLQEVLHPPCTDEQVDGIYALTDKRNDRKVSAEELYRALVDGPVKDSLKKMQNENRIIKELEHLLGFNVQVNRKTLVNSLRSQVNRDDAFRTLPFSIAYICIFICLVIGHLNIWERQQVERGLEAWVEGYGGKLAGPYLGSVANIDGMFDWLSSSGIAAVFGACTNSSHSREGFPSCEVGSRNKLVSDAVLQQTRRDGSERSVWLLHSEQAQASLHESPGNYLGAVGRSIKHLHNISWADANTVDVRLSFTTYGALSGLFAMSNVKVRFDDFGFVIPSAIAAAVVVTPYPLTIFPKILAFLVDALYVFFLLFPMFCEVKDLCRTIHLSGFADGVRRYFGVWNCVDWFNILMGIAMCNIWILCCAAMQADSISGLLQEKSDRMVLVPGYMDLNVDALDQLRNDSLRILNLYFGLHVVMGLTSLGLMLKFFKAFQANPKLKLVTDTMAKATKDILHFSIVFCAIFLGFAVSGHILFGNDLVQFRSFSASVDTCFVMLMGEFAWYDAQNSSELGLPSGLAYWALVIWFWLYMVLVLMILINMLLAIILEHYGELVNQIRNDVDVQALWEQAWGYMLEAKKKKNFVHDSDMLCLLEDPDTPCHESDRVTLESLLAAFPDMKKDQAEWLMIWLKSEAKKKLDQIDDEVVGRLKVLEHFSETIMTDLNSVKLNTAICTSRLNVHSQKEIKRDEVLGYSRHSGVGDKLGVQIDQLVLQVGAALRETSSKLGDATRTIDRRIAGVKMSCESTRYSNTALPQEGSLPVMHRDTSRQMPKCWETNCVS